MTEHYEIRKTGNVSTGAVPTREFQIYPTDEEKDLTERSLTEAGRPSNTGI